MKQYIQKVLREGLMDLRTLSTPKDIEVQHSDIDRIKALEWNQLILEPQNEESPVKILVDVPWESRISDAVDLYIQLTGNNLYQIDINMAPNLRGMGLGYKIYKGLILNFGHIYSGNKRRHNNAEVPAILSKLKSESEIEVHENHLGFLCVAVNAPDKQDIINRFNGKRAQGRPA